MSEHAGPTGGDERVDAVARAIRDNVALLVLASGTTLEQFERQTPGIVRAIATQAVRAADAVAAQDPAPQDGGDAARADLGALLGDLTGERDPEALDSWADAVLGFRFNDTRSQVLATRAARRRAAEAVAAQDPAPRAEPVAWLWRRAAGDDGVRHVPDVNNGSPISTMRLGEQVTYPTRKAAEARARTWGGTVHPLVEQHPRTAEADDGFPGTTPDGAARALHRWVAGDRIVDESWAHGWVDVLHDAVGEDDDTHDGPAVTEPPC